MTRLAVWGGCLVLALAAGVAHAGGVNLITNGDFEDNGGMGQIDSTPFISYLTQWSSAASNKFNFALNAGADDTGFQSIYANIFFWGPQTPPSKGGPVSNGFGPSPNGGMFLGMCSFYNTDAVSQSISNLDTSKTYTLSFEYAFAQVTDHSVASTQSITVDFGSSSDSTASVTLPGKGFLGWSAYSHDFTPASATQSLSFLAVGTTYAGGFALIDNVRLVEKTAGTVPEPGTMALAGLGAGLLVAMRTRQRNTTA